MGRALKSACSGLFLCLACACSNSVRYDAAALYSPQETANIATLSNSATIILYSVDGERIPDKFEENVWGHFTDKSYEKLVGMENSIESGFHCLLFQSIYNNEILQIPAYLEGGRDYQIIIYAYVTPANPGAALIMALAGGIATKQISRFVSLFDKEKVENATFSPAGGGTFLSDPTALAPYDQRYDSQDEDEEAAFRRNLEESEITGKLRTGQYHQVVFHNYAETNFRLAKKNVSDEQVRICPPVRLMMMNGVKQNYLDYLKYPPSIEGAES